jgi:hypothetical protein
MITPIIPVSTIPALTNIKKKRRNGSAHETASCL